MFGDSSNSYTGSPADGAGEPDKAMEPTDSAQSLGAPASTGYDSHSSPMASGTDDQDDKTDEPTENPSEPAADDDLLDLKQQALQQLSPLVSHLDQTPEEKFRTTMMLIQASDNKDLLKEAFEAAQAITDDKAKAQALLDIINEINYFTQPKSSDAE